MYRAYHEQPECVSHALHEQLVLSEVLLVDVEQLWVVEIADQEKRHEKPDNDIDAREGQHARTDAYDQADNLAAPENKAKELIL